MDDVVVGGPTFYYARAGMNTKSDLGISNPDGLYGTYTYAVQYYWDVQTDVRPMSWYISYEYAEYCSSATSTCDDGCCCIFGGHSGTLTALDPINQYTIQPASSSWSSSYSINYQEDASSCTVPAVSEVMSE